ncbi:SIR2 family protein [Polycladidibacter stylochi]|uniref:SIR2 family protein n=1 Tax=Polycladidibacter stylochi TaxID=1807766 RepID=UPI0009E85F24|nr:SIR2 family protein [Pseudovibrio stylochi]
MADFRQVLSQGRKRIGFLVGAGAPLSIWVDENQRISGANDSRPLIPGVDELTRQAIEGLEDHTKKDEANRIREELGKSANIETILSKVRLLFEALGPLEVNGKSGNWYGELGKDICEQIGKIVGVSLPSDRNAYNDLVTWIGGTSRKHPIEIFTTNYDLLFEAAFERSRTSYFDGFTGAHEPFFDPVSVATDDLPSRWARLWKMHGSLGWESADHGIVRTGNMACSELVYPDHLKYDLTQKQPYAALFERLKNFLLTPDSVLITTGFSFRDAHICAVLGEALSKNANSAVVAFQFGLLDHEEPAVKMAVDHPNLSVYAWDGAVINSVQGQWKPGEMPKNWEQIRPTYWGELKSGLPHCFILGDYSKLAGFCLQAKATDLSDARNTGETNADATAKAAPEDRGGPSKGETADAAEVEA